MNGHAPTIDTALIPGIRRVIEINQNLSASTIARFSTSRITARSVLRSMGFIADTTLERAINIFIRIAFGDTTSPAAADFRGTGLIMPDGGTAGGTPEFAPDPATAAADIPVNFQLPDRQGRLLFEVNNTENVIIVLKIRLILDGLGRIGGGDGGR